MECRGFLEGYEQHKPMPSPIDTRGGQSFTSKGGGGELDACMPQKLQLILQKIARALEIIKFTRMAFHANWKGGKLYKKSSRLEMTLAWPRYVGYPCKTVPLL